MAVTFVTTAAGTIGLLFAFLGVNASEVDPARSMFDRHYLPIYLTIAALVLVGVIVFASTAWLQAGQRDNATRTLHARTARHDQTHP